LRSTAWSDLAGCTCARYFSGGSWLSGFFRKGDNNTENTKTETRGKKGNAAETGTDANNKASSNSSSTILREGSAKLLVGEEDVALRRRTQYHLSNPSIVGRELSLILLENFISKRREELQANMKHMHLRIWKSDKAMSRKQARESEKPPDLLILDALAAPGMRALRYALELPEVSKVYANDMDPAVVEAMKRSVAHNGLEEKVEVVQSDPRVLMLQKPDEYYDVIDLDLYKEPVTLLDSAVQSICDGGLLCVTSIGLDNLCAHQSEVCWMKYGSFPIYVGGEYCREMSIRILLQNIQAHAGRYKRLIVPVFSYEEEGYVKTFVRVFTTPPNDVVRAAASKVSNLYQCVDCLSFHFQPVGVTYKVRNGKRVFKAGQGPPVGNSCNNCGGEFRMGGPIWTDPIHDKTWVKDALRILKTRGWKGKDSKTYSRLHNLLSLIKEELPDVPLSVCLNDMTRILKCSPPPANDVRFAIANAGYRVSSTHHDPNSIKTDASFDVLWDIMRCHLRDHPPRYKPEKGTPAYNIMAKSPKLEPKFSRVSKVMKRKRKNNKQK
jgi:tRNA (guanine26-N2/guanine27-N2)-dimethyltransferase